MIFLQNVQRCLTTVKKYDGDGVARTLISVAKNSVKDVIIAGRASTHPCVVIVLCKGCNHIPVDLTFIADQVECMIKRATFRICQLINSSVPFFHT